MSQDTVHYASPEPTVSMTQKELMNGNGRAVFGLGYVFIPREVLNDFVASRFPYWDKTKAYVLTSPDMSHETDWCWHIVYCEKGGGSQEPESEAGVEGFLFVLGGQMLLKVGADKHELTEGGFAYMPPDTGWSVLNPSDDTLKFIWVRKLYQPVRGLKPKMLIGNEKEMHPPVHPSGTAKILIPWAEDMAYDMSMAIVNFPPGNFIPFVETHVHQHGLYLLSGQGMYLVNERWHEVRGGDYFWMHAWCPQACYAGGVEPMRYLLYKNVNRQFSMHR